MKNLILKNIFFIFTTFIVLMSCEDDDKNPLFVDKNPDNFGVFVTIEQQTLVIDFTNPESTYDFTIMAPADNVTEYRLRVARTSGETVSDTVLVESATTFPANFSVSAADLANALSISTEDLSPGDKFDFISEATGINGEVASFANLTGDATGPGMFQGFNHTTFLSCPFVASDAVGSYSVTNDGFGQANASFEVISGPDDGTVTVTGLFEQDFDISVDIETGIATIPRQPVKADFFGFEGGNINTSATSFFFSCTGAVILTLQYTVDLGSFGSESLSAQKN